MCVFATQQPFHSWTIRAARKFQFDMFGRCLVAVFQSWSQSGNRFFPSGTSQTTNKHYRPTERFKLKQFEPYNIVFGGKFMNMWAVGPLKSWVQSKELWVYSTYSLLSGEPSFPITWSIPGLGCSGCRVFLTLFSGSFQRSIFGKMITSDQRSSMVSIFGKMIPDRKIENLVVK